MLLIDQAGWHLTPKLALPGNISIVAITSKSPKLNPPENVWQFKRGNWLSNRVVGSYDEIVDHWCDAWNKIIEQLGGSCRLVSDNGRRVPIPESCYKAA